MDPRRSSVEGLYNVHELRVNRVTVRVRLPGARRPGGTSDEFFNRDIGSSLALVIFQFPGSGEVEKNRWSNLDQLKPRDEIKFVIADRHDYDWARRTIEERNLTRWTILFSPVWGELELKPLAEWMLADRVPARLQTQLHKHIWGEIRGV